MAVTVCECTESKRCHHCQRIDDVEAVLAPQIQAQEARKAKRKVLKQRITDMALGAGYAASHEDGVLHGIQCAIIFAFDLAPVLPDTGDIEVLIDWVLEKELEKEKAMTTDEQGACKSCGAAIRYATTVNGKKIPLNFLPDPKGNIRLQDGLKAFYLKKDDQYDGERYMPHHATCPNAAEYRKTKDPSLKIEDVYAEPKQVPDPKPAVVDRTGGN